jgi:hypothetical protein
MKIYLNYVLRKQGAPTNVGGAESGFARCSEGGWGVAPLE